MAVRSVRSHGQFFMPHLKTGVSVLDCGCGPGSITLGIAELVAPGKVVGVDFGAAQIAGAQSSAASRGIANIAFLAADSYCLPLAESSFDRVFRSIEMSARYECYSSLPLIGEYLALQLEKQNDLRSADTLRKWSQVEGGMFAQCWVSCIAYKHK